MERDAPAPGPVPPADPVPQYPPRSARRTLAAGVGMTAAAAALGLVGGALGSPPAAFTPVQLFLAFVGVVTAGAAVSMRPDLWWAWAGGAAAALLGSVGLPASWDSFPQLFRAAAGVAAAGAVLVRCPVPARVAVASAVILFHFTGIFTATTSPPPQPWVVEQAWTRVYEPYLRFVYLRNAYHFYSPDPGPASVLVFHLKTEPKEPGGAPEYRWVLLPKRPEDVRDPLGVSYYRRLSLTEHAARPGAGLLAPADQAEKKEAEARRFQRSPFAAGRGPGAGGKEPIPYHPFEPPGAQYFQPSPEVSRFLLPSYASHVILEHTSSVDEARRTTVKVYRLQHRTLPVDQFVRRMPNGQYQNPYHPGTFRPYFLGEYNARGDLLNPEEELLYWLVPVLPRFPGPGDPNPKDYDDYMSAHALGLPIEAVRAAAEQDGRVFDWSLLR
ncbi:MAG: hypothetical protein C0501_30035 [Isosphaera sp.]|nr:hypothetical protein [Isosphaera sp.]